MTTYTPRELSGSLFKNDKGDNPNRPDYRGDICIGGVVYSLSAWIKEGQRGKFMSLQATPKPATQPAAYADAPAPAPAAAPARRPSQAEQDAKYASERRAREAQQAQPKPVSGTGFDSMDDDIPF